jgi:hypothetical protein
MKQCMLLASIFLFTSVAAAAVKEEHFDTEPGWDSYNNLMHPATWPVVTQNFGFSPTNHAGDNAGEIGGIIQRSSTPAYYAMKLDKPLTLREPIHFEADFSVQKISGGISFGLFNPDDIRQGGRPMNSLIFEMAGKRRVLAFVRLHGTDARATGTMLPAGKKPKQSPGIANDSSKHHISVDYDPSAHDGRGLVTVQVSGIAPEEFEVPAGFKDLPISFTHFGLLNGQRPGSAMEVYFDDVVLNGRGFHFDADPAWEARGNHVTFEDHEPGGVQQYGFVKSNFAGGSVGEAGGVIWNTETNHSYYGDRVGPFTLEDKLEASGTVTMRVGGPDSQTYIGFFNGDSIKSGKQANCVAVNIVGPTRIGHYFRPSVIGADGSRAEPKEGPRLEPDGKPHAWTLSYNPQDAIARITLDGKSISVSVPKELRQCGATVDHFGIFSGFTGGDQLKLYIDDVKYSSSK